MQNKQESIFVVTSTINTNIGRIHRSERFLQTIETLESIKNHAPDSKIIFVENSLFPIGDQECQVISGLVDFYIDIGSRSLVRYFNIYGTKGAGESIMLLVALDLIEKNKISADRIFKLSGRYKLSTSFDLAEYYNSNFDNKLIFKKRHLFLNKFCLDTRLWSFCSSLLNYSRTLLQESFRLLLFTGCTIEEAIFKNIDLNYLVEFEKIHCEGYLAECNMLIKE